MQSADRNKAVRCFNPLIKHLEWQPSLADRLAGTIKFGIRTDEHADFVRPYQ